MAASTRGEARRSEVALHLHWRPADPPRGCVQARCGAERARARRSLGKGGGSLPYHEDATGCGAGPRAARRRAAGGGRRAQMRRRRSGLTPRAPRCWGGGVWRRAGLRRRERLRRRSDPKLLAHLPREQGGEAAGQAKAARAQLRRRSEPKLREQWRQAVAPGSGARRRTELRWRTEPRRAGLRRLGEPGGVAGLGYQPSVRGIATQGGGQAAVASRAVCGRVELRSGAVV